MGRIRELDFWQTALKCRQYLIADITQIVTQIVAQLVFPKNIHHFYVMISIF